MVKARFVRLLVTMVLTFATGLGLAVATTQTARADGCYTWSGTLRVGASGEAVTRLQIRIAGWMTSGEVLAIDGRFGPATERALIRFQQGYDLAADGVAGRQTFNKIYELQNDDCTPIHFSFAEATRGCNSDFSGGTYENPRVPRENVLRGLWKLEALRHKLGDQPIRITSGFRDFGCNPPDSSSTSLHLRGEALDLGAGSHSLCRLAQEARSAGFRGIYGPGFPHHNDHVHLSTGERWSAPTCGI